MRPYLFPLLLLPLLQSQPQPSAVAIQAGRNVRVTDKAAPFIEPSITAHPSDRKRLIISATQIIANEGDIARVFFTKDGGETWSPAFLPQMQHVLSGGRLRTAIDNWVTYAPDGTAYLSSLARIKIQDQWKLAILVYRSMDKGETWLGPSIVTGATFDRPVIAAATKGTVYIASLASGVAPLGIETQADAEGILILRSTDFGAYFKPAGFIVPDALGHNAMNPILLPDGALIVPYGDYPLRSGQHLKSSRMYIIRSRDGAQTFDLPQLIGDIPRPLGGFFHLAVDTSNNRFSGRIYAAWNGGDIGPDRRRGSRRDVSVAYSSDGGQTWSLPKVLYAEGAGPAYFTAIAVSASGTVGVGWLQHESDGDKADCYRIYFAASADGGQTFSPARLVSDSISCPDNPAHTAPMNFLGGRTILQRWARGGDYIGLSSTADNSFQLVWCDGRDGPFQVYSARIDVQMKASVQ